MKTSAYLLSGIAAVALSLGTAHAGSFSFTNDADWDLGTYSSTNSGPPGADDQVQLNPGIVTQFDHIWIALSGRNTAVRVDTNTGVVLGEYYTAPQGQPGNPSRTTVDQNGDVWIGNRNQSTGNLGSVVKISATPTGPTSSGLGNVLPWSNAGGADTNGGTSTAQDSAIQVYTRTAGTNVRTIAVDANNDVWVGGYGNKVHQKLDGTTGAALGAAFNLAPGGYGGLIDGNGILWSSGWSSSDIARYDTVNNVALPTVGTGGRSYGLGVDSQGNIWNSHYDQGTISKLDSNGNLLFTRPTGGNGGRGVAVTPDDHVWIANSFTNTVTHMDNNGNIIATVPVGRYPTGVSVDSNGKVWVTNRDSNNAQRIDPLLGAGGAVDLTVDLGAGAAPYNYSDMTGSVVQAITNPTGTWATVIDSGVLGTMWDKIFWNEEAEGTVPAGTSITIEVRTADTLAGLAGAAFMSYLSGDMLTGLIGQFAEVKATLTRSGAVGSPSPVLSDLRLTTVMVPEAGTLAMFAIGALALVGTAARRRRSA